MRQMILVAPIGTGFAVDVGVWLFKSYMLWTSPLFDTADLHRIFKPLRQAQKLICLYIEVERRQ